MGLQQLQRVECGVGVSSRSGEELILLCCFSAKLRNNLSSDLAPIHRTSCAVYRYIFFIQILYCTVLMYIILPVCSYRYHTGTRGHAEYRSSDFVLDLPQQDCNRTFVSVKLCIPVPTVLYCVQYQWDVTLYYDCTVLYCA